MSKKMKILFTVSVFLNILLLGALTSFAYHKWDHRRDRAQQMTENMSPEGRHIVARTMQNAFRNNAKTMRTMRQTKREIKEILSAEEFDEEAFEEASKKMQDLFAQMGEKRIEVTKEMAAKMSAEDRAQLAERFSKGFRGHNPKDVRGNKLHKFLKGFEKGERVKERRSSEEGPELPDDMPPQP